LFRAKSGFTGHGPGSVWIELYGKCEKTEVRNGSETGMFQLSDTYGYKTVNRSRLEEKSWVDAQKAGCLAAEEDEICG